MNAERCCARWPHFGPCIASVKVEGCFVVNTGWPPGLLQDDCKALSRWFASQPDARRRVREALAELEKGEPWSF